MQCRSQTGGYYYPRYLNVGLSGHSWPITQGDVTWSSGQNFNVLLPPSTMDHNVGYQKEIFRQMMLKHEATFKYQVYELHRLYGRQKELMEEIRKREILNRNLKPHLVSELRSDFSFCPSSNLSGVEPSSLSAQMPREPPYFLKPAPDQYPTKGVLKECELSSSRINKSGKRMLDLELPACEYEDSDEDNIVHVPKMPVSHHIDPKLDSFSPGGSSISHSSFRNANVLFDLNAPAEPDELGQDLCGQKCVVLNNEATPDIPEGEGADHCDRTSGHSPTANIKVSDSKNLPKVVDLNMFPADYSSDDDFSGNTYKKSRSAPLEREDREMDCSGKSGIVNSSFSPNPTVESQEYDGGNRFIDTGVDSNSNSGLEKEFVLSPHEQSDTTEAATQRDLEAPVSPENKECAPPRGDSQDNQLERCISSLKLEGEIQEEEEDRVAADTLFVLASSGIQRYSKTKFIDQNEAFNDCLDWFAGIASSLVNNQQTHDAKEMEIVDASLPSRLKRGQKKMKLQPNNFQKEVNKDLHTALEHGSARRSVSRCSRGRGRRQSKASEMTACSVSKQHSDGKKHSSADRCLPVWGKTKRRQMARVARSISHSPL
ncbi:uncharacterized protein LOC116022793 [Ipomoea triloba]|uniref:uncharacterized protein LOC116022793 n=1 Tax=Ipomoea triloba TaxID=35885 RepID=UPI00125DE1C8|nr:uncharacterized protein LOC116022793 [Ipomoea triloba]XP_031119532.1 uncharacterized protein LOC116022793 [Ipomoea triloba]XP_031119533.1 uncharacterized protein LOC116022793 [Ipomoea triloba]